VVLASVRRLALEDFASCLTCQKPCESAHCFVALFVRHCVATILVEMWIAARRPLARSSSSTHNNSASTDGPRNGSTICRGRPQASWTVRRTERRCALVLGVKRERRWRAGDRAWSAMRSSCSRSARNQERSRVVGVHDAREVHAALRRGSYRGSLAVASEGRTQRSVSALCSANPCGWPGPRTSIVSACGAEPQARCPLNDGLYDHDTDV
jgi:hypothetical protein